jgi:hypothetical protein
VATGSAVVGAILLGYVAGLLSFKVKLRWCRECGATLRCLDCQERKRRTLSGMNPSGRS